MFINASPDSRSLDMVDLRYVFNLLSVLNKHSHSADVIGNDNVNGNGIKVWMLGKKCRSHAVSVSQISTPFKKKGPLKLIPRSRIGPKTDTPF